MIHVSASVCLELCWESHFHAKSISCVFGIENRKSLNRKEQIFFVLIRLSMALPLEALEGGPPVAVAAHSA